MIFASPIRVGKTVQSKYRRAIQFVKAKCNNEWKEYPTLLGALMSFAADWQNADIKYFFYITAAAKLKTKEAFLTGKLQFKIEKRKSPFNSVR